MDVKSLFRSAAATKQLRQPIPTSVPELKSGQIAAVYRAARTGGDFYDFVTTESARLVFVLMDIAGKREQAMDIAAYVQESFRSEAPRLLGPSMLNQADALTTLMLALNRSILEAADGVRCAPTFLGCYDEPMGALWYLNAGHPPGLLRDHDGITALEANGIPLGLFSHSTHDAQVCVLQPGAALLLASKGVVECKHKSEEFGVERLKEALRTRAAASAYELCQSVLDVVDNFARGAPQNDITTMVLMRS